MSPVGPEAIPFKSQKGNPYSLEGEICLITGGGSGLGFGIARAFVASGARVVLVGRRESVLASAVEELGGAAIYEVHDITQHDKSEELVRRITDRLGVISVLVNNAGILLKKSFAETSATEFFLVVDTHLLASSCLTRAVVPNMVARRRGSILFIASMTSLFGMPNVAAYAAANQNVKREFCRGHRWGGSGSRRTLGGPQSICALQQHYTLPIPPVKQHQFAGTLGGPVEKSRTFFFDGRCSRRMKPGLSGEPG